MKKSLLLPAIITAWLIVCSAPRALSQGALTPPAAPAPTMKTLDQIEPRTLINSLPFTITSPGSYYLAQNLTGSAGNNGITINAPNVTVDLNGFSLTGVAGALNGISAVLGATHARVTNGIVSGWPGMGINAIAHNAQVDHVTASENSGGGIFVGPNSVIAYCVAAFNGYRGMYSSTGSVVSHCVASENSSDGGVFFDDTAVSECAFRSNTGDGASFTPGVSFVNCTSSNNSGNGFAGYNDPTGARLTNCSANENGANGIYAGAGALFISHCLAVGNKADGIQIYNDSRVSANQSDSNSGAGIHAGGTENRIDNNNVSRNGRGYRVDGIRNLVVSNTARNNSSLNYTIVTGNRVGSIVIPPLSGVISGDSDSSALGVGTTDPWANISY